MGTVLVWVVLVLIWGTLLGGAYVFASRVTRYPDCAEKLFGWRRPPRPHRKVDKPIV